MDWRTSHVEKRTPIEIDGRLAAHPGNAGPLAVVADGDFAPGGARLRLGAALFRDLQMARIAGQRFGLTE